MKAKFFFFRMTSILVLIGLLFGNAVIPVRAASANDDFDTPVEITSVPYTHTDDTTAATTALDDPVFPCGSLDQGANSVWYSFTPAEDGTLYVDTQGSSFDTMLAVWTGTRGSLNNVTCNDDYIGGLSVIRTRLTAGVTYYIEAAGRSAGADMGLPKATYGDRVPAPQIMGVDSGTLQLHVNFGNTCPDLDDQNNLPLFTTRDNEDNAGTHVCDNDMDQTIFKTDSIAPIEFTINVPYADDLTSTELLLLANDVDFGEIDKVYFNGHDAGDLTGANNEWSTTSLDLDPAWVMQGDNLVQIVLTDVGWSVTLDWAQLVLNGQTNGTAFIRSLTTDKSTYVTTNTIKTTIEVDTPLPTQQLRTEINLLDTKGEIITGKTINHTITGLEDDAVVASLLIPAGTPPGTYKIQVIVYDRRPNLYQDSSTADVAIYTRNVLTVRSIGTYDGHILETSEKSNKGGAINPTGITFNLGDDAANRQYRAILSFNTKLPKNAVITGVTLKIRKAGLVGVNPFLKFGGLKVDIRKPFFGANVKLAGSDFQAAANKASIGTFGKTPVNNWYSAVIGSAGYPFINRNGTTQFRLRFTLDDNNNKKADYMKFYSGNYKTVTLRPTLIIEYYIP